MLNYLQHQRTTRVARKSYMLQEKRSKLVSMGNCAFSVVPTKYWNELPDDIRNIELPLDIFKKKLKTHLKYHIVEKKCNDCLFLNRITLYKYVMLSTSNTLQFLRYSLDKLFLQPAGLLAMGENNTMTAPMGCGVKWPYISIIIKHR